MNADESGVPEWLAVSLERIEQARRDHVARLTVGSAVRIVVPERCNHHGTQEHGVRGVIYADDGSGVGNPDPEHHRYHVGLSVRLRGIGLSWFYRADELETVDIDAIVADLQRAIDAESDTVHSKRFE